MDDTDKDLDMKIVNMERTLDVKIAKRLEKITDEIEIILKTK